MSNLSRTLPLILALLGLGLSGCTKRESSDRVVSARGTAVTGGTTNPGTGGTSTTPTDGLFVEKCSNGSSAVGYVYDGGVPTTGESFRDRVAGLVSASLDPQQLGDISGEEGGVTGIDFRLRLKSDGQGGIVATASHMQFMIFDSLVGQLDSAGAQIVPYEITMTKTGDVQNRVEVSGNVDQANRTFTVTFRDDYGNISLQGRWDGSVARGTITFENFRSYDNSTPRSGMLGSFAVPTCGLF